MRRELQPKKLSVYFAETVTGDYNQDISFLLVGKKGQGKSYAQLSIAYHTAKAIAEIQGGTWSDYFGMENVAIVDPLRAVEVITNAQKNNVYIYDDIGIGWNARDFAKEDNKSKNDIFQINRVDNTVQMFSVPNQFLLDKVPRSLVSHYGEMDQQFFKFGFTTLKLFEPRTLFREGKQLQPYLFVNRQKFIKYVIPAPPDELRKEYDKERARITKLLIQQRKEMMTRNAEGGASSTGIGRNRYSAKEKVARALEYVNLGESVRSACFRAGCPESTFFRKRREVESELNNRPTPPRTHKPKMAVP
ncbi:MAG TPA: hypothetical protein PKV78_13605 [Methanoculleus thermophilus]|nr:hypothetical protein [Methanoculleus thermophilus]HRD26399.1 hypothetical protein [Methanoculleus sp.]